MKIVTNVLCVIVLAILINVGYEYYQGTKGSSEVDSKSGGTRVERNIMKDEINDKIKSIESQGGEIVDVQIEDQMNVDTYTIIYKE